LGPKSSRWEAVTRASLNETAALLILAVSVIASVSAAQDVPPSSGWSEPERWAWEQIRVGRAADFNTRDGKLDPRKPGGWDSNRELSPGFLWVVLFREPYRSAIPVEGVRIIGAWFPERVDLVHGRLDRQLSLERCRFEEAVDLFGLHVDGWLSFDGSAFAEQQGTDSYPKVEGSSPSGRTIFQDAFYCVPAMSLASW
jgi:hypothetical protein